MYFFLCFGDTLMLWIYTGSLHSLTHFHRATYIEYLRLTKLAGCWSGTFWQYHIKWCQQNSTHHLYTSTMWYAESHNWWACWWFYLVWPGHADDGGILFTSMHKYAWHISVAWAVFDPRNPFSASTDSFTHINTTTIKKACPLIF